MSNVDPAEHVVSQNPRQQDRQLYGSMLHQIAAEMQAELESTKTMLHLVSSELEQRKPVKAFRAWLTQHDIAIHSLLSWHNRFPEPTSAPATRYNKEQIAARRKAKEDKQLSEIVKNASEWLSNYATWRASMIGFDQIPEIANAAVFAINNGLIYQPVSLMRRARLSREPLLAEDQSLHSFWEQVVLPAVEKEFGDRFSASNADPFKPLCDRIAATEILAVLIGAGTGGVETKLAEAPAAAAETPAAANESQVEGPRSDGDREAQDLHEQNHKPAQSGKLIVDKGAREALWNGRTLKINREADFCVLARLWEQVGEIVHHQELLIAIKPHERLNIRLTAAPPEVRDAIGHIRAALKTFNAGYRIDPAKSRGFILRSTNT